MPKVHCNLKLQNVYKSDHSSAHTNEVSNTFSTATSKNLEIDLRLHQTSCI